MGGIEHDYAEVNGVRLHYAHAGKGPLMMFLHGFPQCWYMWRHQLREFGRDHRVVAPDLRGYNLSSKPARLADYGAWHAAEDIRQLADVLGHERLVLVGHDWGVVTAWSFALHFAERLDALVTLATPHPGTFDRALHESPEQQKASQYLLGLRRPEAEDAMSADDFAVPRGTLAAFPFITDEGLTVYADAWRQPGGMSGPLAWFRREGLGPPDEDGTPARGNWAPEVTPLTVDVPTLVIYPDADVYTRPPAHEGLDRYVPDLTFKTIEGGSHWIAEERPELVNEYIREFLRTRAVAFAGTG